MRFPISEIAVSSATTSISVFGHFGPHSLVNTWDLTIIFTHFPNITHFQQQRLFYFTCKSHQTGLTRLVHTLEPHSSHTPISPSSLTYIKSSEEGDEGPGRAPHLTLINPHLTLINPHLTLITPSSDPHHTLI